MILILSCAIGALAGPSLGQDVPRTTRLVRDVTERTRGEEIGFVSFTFQQPSLFRELTVHYRPIDGAPSIGEQYGVEASVAGQEAIATLLFEAIGEDGATIEPVPMVARSSGVPGDYDFIGMMTVPSRPFRVRMSGEDVYGQRFSRVDSRLFKPTLETPGSELLPPEFAREAPPDLVRQIERMFDEAREDRRAIVIENPSGRIVMPRSRVLNVRYAPVVSAAGRPLGVKITYDVEFTQAGRYNPELRIFAEDKEDSAIGRNPLRPLRSSIQPVPHEVHAPLKEAEAIPGFLAHRADFLYQAGTYTFAVEMVPDFVMVLRDLITPCLWKQPPQHSEEARKAFARRLARQQATVYRVWIGGRGFQGRIDEFHGEGTFFQSFLAEGLAECEYPAPSES